MKSGGQYVGLPTVTYSSLFRGLRSVLYIYLPFCVKRCDLQYLCGALQSPADINAQINAWVEVFHELFVRDNKTRLAVPCGESGRRSELHVDIFSKEIMLISMTQCIVVCINVLTFAEFFWE